MKLSSRTRCFLALCAALGLLCLAGPAAFAFPESALAPARSTASDLIIMAVSAVVGILGGLWIFLRTRSRRTRLRK
jgi:hypothetical protein